MLILSTALCLAHIRGCSHFNKSTIKNDNADQTRFSSYSLAILFGRWHFPGSEKQHYVPIYFLPEKMPPQSPVLLPSSWPCFPTPVTVYCCMGTAGFEEEGEPFGISFHSNSPFFWWAVCESSLVLPSNVQHVKDHKTQKAEMAKSLSSGISLSICSNWSWWELEHLFLDFCELEPWPGSFFLTSQPLI